MRTLFSASAVTLSLLALAPWMQAQTRVWPCRISAVKSLFRFDTQPDTATRKGCSSSHSFVVSTPLAEGNYLVTVELGGDASSITTVKAEGRRLMLHAIATSAHQTRRERFAVNIREPQIAPGREVHRKPREMHALDWDDRLTLEFSGTNPSVRSIFLEPAASLPTVYLAGDSTVVDQANEPWAAWGQMLPAFFSPRVAISNQAESGETIGSFESELRFEKIFSTIKAGDFLLMQFAHNDQKPGPGFVSPERYTALLRKYIAMARDKGATPMLVTSMNRRTFDSDGKVRDTLAPYPELTRSVAASEHIELIDLNAMSKTLYEAIGEPNSRILFVYAAANTFPNQAAALHDDTHFNNYGAYELARCIVWAMQQQHMPLATLLRNGIPAFAPSKPDDPAAVAIPASPFFDTEKPYER